MSPTPRWDPPSPAVAELIREATAKVLNRPEELFAAVDAAILADPPQRAGQDPVVDHELVEAIRASTRSNLAHWAAANIAEPGAYVPPNMVPETVELAREIVRRGYDDAALSGYRIGENVAWRLWMQAAFSVSSDPRELHEMLDITARSAFTFVDEMLAALKLEMDREREQLGGSAWRERLQAIEQIIENPELAMTPAAQRLRREIDSWYVAAIVWSDEIGPRDFDALHAVAEELNRRCRDELSGGRRMITVMPNHSTLWAWIPAGRGHPVPESVSAPPGVRVALGQSGSGLPGFRASHLQARALQDLMRRIPPDRKLVFATHQQLEVVLMVAGDLQAAHSFVRRTLGLVAVEDPVLRETLRTYIAQQYNVSRTAELLFAHRNTVLGRIRRAEQLLSRSLAEHGVEVALALEIEHWLGPRPDPVPDDPDGLG